MSPSHNEMGMTVIDPCGVRHIFPKDGVAPAQGEEPWARREEGVLGSSGGLEGYGPKVFRLLTYSFFNCFHLLLCLPVAGQELNALHLQLL